MSKTSNCPPTTDFIYTILGRLQNASVQSAAAHIDVARFVLKQHRIPHLQESNVERYANLGGNSGVRAFACADTYLDVQFSTGMHYRDSYSSAGSSAVEHTKELAVSGRGLGAFISSNKPNQEAKW